MIKRIELTNFMSHKHTVLELGPGLTVLVGPNNCGKSAVASALHILCYNDLSNYVCRHGERECSVKVVTDDGHEVIWRRRGQSVSYVIDGQTFDRIGRGGPPDELHQVLRLPKVDAGDNSNDSNYDIHFASQKSPIFLLSDTASPQAAKFFASSSDVIRLIKMQNRHKEKLRARKDEKKRLEAKSQRLNAELQALEPVVELEKQLAAATESYHELLKQQEYLDKGHEHLRRWQRQAAEAQRCHKRLAVLQTLAAPPELADCQPLEKLIASLTAQQSKVAEARQNSAVLTQLVAPPQLAPAEALETLVARIQRLAGQVAQGKAADQALAPLTAPPELADTAALARLVEQLVEAERRCAAASMRQTALQDLTTAPELGDDGDLAELIASLERCERRTEQLRRQNALLEQTHAAPELTVVEPLAKLIEQYAAAATKVAQAQQAYAEAEAECAEVEQQLRDKAAGAICPTCGSPVDAQRLLAHTAQHGGTGHDH